MTEAPSTRTVGLAWAKEERSNPVPTSFFFFTEDQGRVVVREPAEKKDASQEMQVTTSGIFAGIAHSFDSKAGAEEKGSLNEVQMAVNGVFVGTAHSFVPKTARRVPQTKLVRSSPNQRYILLKKYEGFVTVRTEETFSARLFESNSDYPAVEAEFDLEELSETDRELAVEGAPMVWTIGYGYDGSTRKRESLIYFRRLPAWSEKELEKARTAAEELSRAIRWE